MVHQDYVHVNAYYVHQLKKIVLYEDETRVLKRINVFIVCNVASSDSSWQCRVASHYVAPACAQPNTNKTTRCPIGMLRKTDMIFL